MRNACKQYGSIYTKADLSSEDIQLTYYSWLHIHEYLRIFRSKVMRTRPMDPADIKLSTPTNVWHRQCCHRRRQLLKLQVRICIPLQPVLDHTTDMAKVSYLPVAFRILQKCWEIVQNPLGSGSHSPAYKNF